MSSTTKKKVKLLSGLDWKPTAYMKRAMKFLLENPMAGLFLDPGLRKTSITLGSFRVLKAAGMVDRMLVVAPLRVCYNVWPAEVQKWKQFQHMKVVILHDKDRIEEHLEDESVDIFVINPEGLEWLLGRKVGKKIRPNNKRFKKLNAQMFVLDESSKFKHTDTKRFKLLKPFLGKFLRRVILTGSPNPRNYLDLFGQVYIIDLGRALGQYITHYRNSYFDPTGFGGFTWKLREGADKLIQDAIRPYVLRMEAEDYIKMPKLVEPDIWVTMPPKAREVYEEIEDELIYILESGEAITAPTASAARGKCAQIAGGAVYRNKDGIEVRNKMTDFITIHDEKIVALEEFLDEMQGQPTLVLYWYKHEAIRIQKALGKKFGSKGRIPDISEASAKQGQLLEDAWNRNEIPVLMGQPASIGHGLNMQGGNAAHLVWYTLPDDYDIYDQTNRRLRRSGNTNSSVFAHRIMARNTVDVAKAAMLKTKGANMKAFLDAMKTYRPRRKK